ncbi:MAG: MOSC N-terminal beta barrel domain-containing protein, partial [Gammaproteobacteria bacterium]
MKTDEMACIQRITLYPIKALDGVSVAQTRIAPGGSLEHDRAFAVVDAQGKFVNGKRLAEVHRLRAHFDLDTHAVTLADSGTRAP